jgi:gamma-glutamyltranspeptidase/glutathione hydrolase/leukotriene-C4 hydrolase
MQRLDEEEALSTEKERFDWQFCMVITFTAIAGLFTLVCAVLGSAFIVSKQRPINYHIYKNGAVATDSTECSQVGVEILQQGGNAIDSAIASAFCLGVRRPFASGIGTTLSFLTI